MKKDKIIYWTFTTLAMLMGGVSAIFYYNTPALIEGFKQLGFPSYFRIELATFKLIGLLVLLLPIVPARVKEWAYAGFGIVFISATIAHINIQGPSTAIAPIVAFIFLVVSYIYFHKINDLKSVKA